MNLLTPSSTILTGLAGRVIPPTVVGRKSVCLSVKWLVSGSRRGLQFSERGSPERHRNGVTREVRGARGSPAVAHRVRDEPPLPKGGLLNERGRRIVTPKAGWWNGRSGQAHRAAGFIYLI